MSNWKIEPYGALCSLRTFTINGIPAHYDDFGDKYDHDIDGAEEFGCGDMQFDPKIPEQEVLDKYKITEMEYISICDELEKVLSFGNCGWCI